jgi:hypothetical protein
VVIKVTKSLARLAAGEYLIDVVRTVDNNYEASVYQLVNGSQVFLVTFKSAENRDIAYSAIDYVMDRSEDKDLKLWTMD